MFKACALFLACVFALGSFPALAQENATSDINAKIRKEAKENSQILRTMHYLTDVYGPRLTGSPNLKAAGEWVVKQMAAWGFENAHLEPWDFGHPGWTNERLTAHIISPVKEPLVCEAVAWTPGTNGTVTAQAFQMILPEHPAPPDKPDTVIGPTQEEMNALFNSIKDKVKGKIVLVGKHQRVPVNLAPNPRRLDEQEAKSRYDPNNPNAGQYSRRRGSRQNEPQDPSRLTSAQINEQVDKFLLESAALLRANDAGREHRQIRAFNNRTFDTSKALPTVVLSNEDYGRISRILADNTPVELEFNIVNRSFPEGRTAYNTIAEIPGTDKKDEVVMLGGHLDSWHSATGATDNAVGCAVMMEAARILRSIGVKPRRTIRVALWSGEEQGLLGSLAYVKEHFGSFENPKPDFAKLVAYMNIDSGTGRSRGVSVFGPPEAATVLRDALAPFADLGLLGAIATKSRGLGGSDHTSFNQAGLPGIGVGQDPIEYNSATWHTNLDTYERIIEEDVKISAIAIASALYQLAMRDEMLPRFTKETMPPLPPPDNAPQTPQPATPQSATPQPATAQPAAQPARP